ncbi:MAG: sulfatase-like hydrolase/transferase [Acidobacteriota bacterium]|nr:sulfatase-like hydrolase/transferase [Acidobacteriota bacterium]
MRQSKNTPVCRLMVLRMKVLAVLAPVLLALSTGCGSSSSPKPPANRAPTAVNPGSQAGITGETASLQIFASDMDGDTLQYSASGLPIGLQINSETGRISGVYGAAGNFSAAVTVTDGKTSVRVEFAWNVTEPPNAPPVAKAQTVFLGFETSRSILLAGSDLENDPLTYKIVANPTSGTLSGLPPNLIYTPNREFSGTDRFQFTVRDGEYESDPAIVTLIVRPEGAAAPNILFVIMDDIGMDTTTQMHPGLIEELTAKYGPQGRNHPLYGRIAGRPASTPTLNTLAQQGIAFTQTWAQPYCSPTRASILTGLYAARTQVLDYADSLSQTHKTVAQLLRDEAGYSTAIFGKWHVAGLGFYPGMKPKQAGFDLFLGNLNGAIDSYWSYDYQIQDATTPPNQWRTEAAPMRSLPGIAPTTYAPVVKAADTIDWITAQESANPNKPWFAWLAFNLSHIAAVTEERTIVPDYDTLDEPTRNEMLACGGVFGSANIGACSAPALNRAMTNSLDTVLGKLLEAVDALDPNTYVIVIGDNGTPMYGPSAINFIDNMYITRIGRAKGTTYESGVRVSMAVRGPGIAPGRTSAAANHCVDLFATILDLAGVPVPANVPNRRGDGVVALDSVSLTPIIFSGAERVRHPDYAYVMSESVNPLADNARQAAAKDATYKLLCTESTQSASCNFYNLVEDPLEEYPLPKPGSCLNFSNGTWTPADREWHFCNLQSILSTQSFLNEPSPGAQQQQIHKPVKGREMTEYEEEPYDPFLYSGGLN